MKALASLILVLFLSPAVAGTATVTWTNPTTRTDGTTFASTIIARTDVEYDDNAGFTSPTTAAATGAATSLVINNIPAGTWYFRASTVLTDGSKSLPSLVVSKVVPIAPPNPPTLQTVTTTAYRFEISPEGYVRLVHVPGLWLPKGEPCTPIPGLATYGISGEYVRRCLSVG